MSTRISARGRGHPDSKLSAVRSLSFVTSVNPDTVRHLDAVSPPAGTTSLPGEPYWQDLIDAEGNTVYNGSGVWVAVLDSGFFPNWRDYFVESDVLTQYARAFIAAGGNQNANQCDVGSDPHGMATAATITGHRFVDDTNEGGWGVGYATGAAGTYWVLGGAPGAKTSPSRCASRSAASAVPSTPASTTSPASRRPTPPGRS